MEFNLDTSQVPEGTVLLFGIRYVGADQEGYARSAEEEARVYTYAMLKAGGSWYVTGGGRTPQVAGWGAVKRWLSRDNRMVVWVKLVTATETLWELGQDQPRVTLKVEGTEGTPQG